MKTLTTILRRLVGTVPLVLAVTAVMFALTRVADGDPARSLLGQKASPEEVSALRDSLGLNDPIPVQYVDYLSRLVRGDLGVSYYSRQAVTDVVAERLPVTLWLLAAGLVLSLLVSIPLALVSARRPDGLVNTAVRTFSVGSFVMPAFWTGVLLLLFVAIPTGWFPVGGFGDTTGERLRAIVLPALTFATVAAPNQIRTLRTSLMASLESDYIDAARARGVGERRLLLGHALPNSILPTITVVTVQAGFMLFSAVVIENTFRLPGLGQGMIQAVGQRDYPIILGITLLFALLVVVFNLVSDLSNSVFDPKVRAA